MTTPAEEGAVPAGMTHDEMQRRVSEAQTLFDAGRLGDAYDVFSDLVAERLLDLYGVDYREWTVTDVDILDRAAWLGRMVGQYTQADLALEEVWQAMSALGEQEKACYFAVRRVDLWCAWRGADEALQLLDDLAPELASLVAAPDARAWEASSAIAGWPESERRNLMGRLLLVLARLMAFKGAYGRARHWLQAFDERLAGRDLNLAHEPALRADAHLVRASVALDGGDWALAARERAVAGVLDRSVRTRVRIDELTAREATLRGDYGAAREAWVRVIQTCDDQQLHRARVQARENLAEVLILVNQTTVATQLLEEALSIADAGGDAFGCQRAEALLALRDARLRSGSARESLCQSVLEMASAGRRTRRDTPAAVPAAEVLDRLSQQDAAAAALDPTAELQAHVPAYESAELGVLIALASGDAGAAAERLAVLLPAFGASESPMIRARLGALEARVAYYGGDLPRATAALDTALPLLRQLDLARDLREAELLRGWCAARVGAVAEHRAAVLASEVQLNRMAGSLPPEERVIFLLNKFSSDEERLAADVARLRALQAEAAEASWFGRMALWRTIAEATLALRAHTDGHRAAIAAELQHGRRSEPPDPDGAVPVPSLLQAMLNEQGDEATLSFLALPQELIAILTWRPGVRAEVIPITRVALRERVARWHAALATARERERQRDLEDEDDEVNVAQADAQAPDTLLADLGLGGLLAELPGRITTLRIVPDDVLHGVPWAALQLQGRYLIQRFALIVGHSSGPLRRRGPIDLHGRQGLLFGVASGTAGVVALDAVPAELDGVQEAWVRAGVALTRLDDATTPRPSREALLQALPGAQLLHAACHGIFVIEKPDQSGLVLVPRPGEAFEVLSVRDLAELDLSGLQHAVLSSCWSADSFVAPGRWVVSLPETLWRAGVGVVLASLWPVVDEFGPAFLARYYAGLASLTPAQALQRAQCDCIEGRLTLGPARPSAAAVSLWAGFQVHL